MSINIYDLTVAQVKQIKEQFVGDLEKDFPSAGSHPMLGRRCLVRTYSAGVHIGDVKYVDGMEIKLDNALRLWSWSDGGLSLSAVATNGVKKARLNKCSEIYLTNVIEIIPTTDVAEATFVKFIED
jgi:hypothetical protein